ncbi:hypothetical protein TU75_18530 [Pseudomonas poae]|uniref:DUF7740 domain-containing protein n=1 Tax=Pseudomonas poae TaxID=200451 RepID=A0ABY0S1B0_9PSED|nr:hypothetical protein [Pseudomonas poae]KRP47812.1 hypothetical protein TU75_18530 [Pseudomonas poae]SDO70171.1 hypothetical protein SAMN04490208_4642 [Pseudomonas poae]
MTLTDAIIVILLAEKIHGTDAAIRNSAKNVAKKLPRSKRSIMYDIADSKSPRELMRHIGLGLDD